MDIPSTLGCDICPANFFISSLFYIQLISDKFILSSVALYDQDNLGYAIECMQRRLLCFFFQDFIYFML